MRHLHIAVIAGTRPEVIKLAPLITHLKSQPELATSFVITGQHRDLRKHVTSPLKLHIDEDLGVASSGQPLGVLYGELTAACTKYFAGHKPDLVICHGDTASAATAGLAAFLSGIPFCHVEAGLRSDDLSDPFPEEFNRRYLAGLASVHYAPDHVAKDRLKKEGVIERHIKVVGNTISDAVGMFQTQKSSSVTPTILLTLHRREKSEDRLRELLLQLRDFAIHHPEYNLVYPLHMNPMIQQLASECLGDINNVTLTPPLEYPQFLAELAKASLVVTDSGGVQEEAEICDTPTIIARHRSERASGFASGRSVLLGDAYLPQLMETMLATHKKAPVAKLTPKPSRVSEAITNDLLERFAL